MAPKTRKLRATLASGLAAPTIAQPAGQATPLLNPLQAFVAPIAANGQTPLLPLAALNPLAPIVPAIPPAAGVAVPTIVVPTITVPTITVPTIVVPTIVVPTIVAPNPPLVGGAPNPPLMAQGGLTPSPFELVRRSPSAQCYIGPSDLNSSEDVLAAYPDSAALLSHTRVTSLRNLAPGDLYLLGVPLSALAIIRFAPHIGAHQYAAAILDGGSAPYPSGVILPLLDMAYIFEPLLGDSITTTVRVVSAAFLDGVLNNQELLRLNRVHRGTRLPPLPVALGWFPASPQPLLRHGSAQIPSPIISSSQEYPRYSVQEKQIQFRRGGPGGLSQQLADTAIGVVAVPKDHMRQHGLSDALVRAISPAPDAALFANTVSGTYAYLYRVTRSALPIWDFVFFLSHAWQFPTDFDVALLSPLTIAFPDAMAQEAFQRELMAFDESKKAAFAARFATVSHHLFGHDVEHLRRALYTYIHIIFAVTLMRAPLQDRIVLVADRLVAIVAGAIRGPYPLVRSLLLAAFAIYRDALREFLAQSGASVLAEDLPARLDHFERTANSVDSNSYLRRLFRSYSDLHSQGQLHGPFIVQSYLITLPPPAMSPTVAHSAASLSSTRADRRAAKRQRTESTAPARGSSSSSVSTTAPSQAAPPQHQQQQQPPRSATSAAFAVAPVVAASAATTGALHICAAFNGVSGCHRENCPMEHICPARGTDRWQALYSYTSRLHLGGTLRNPPAVAFLQGAPWPPAAVPAAAAGRP